MRDAMAQGYQYYTPVLLLRVHVSTLLALCQWWHKPHVGWVRMVLAITLSSTCVGVEGAGQKSSWQAGAPAMENREQELTFFLCVSLQEGGSLVASLPVRFLVELLLRVWLVSASVQPVITPATVLGASCTLAQHSRAQHCHLSTHTCLRWCPRISLLCYKLHLGNLYPLHC